MFVSNQTKKKFHIIFTKISFSKNTYSLGKVEEQNIKVTQINTNQTKDDLYQWMLYFNIVTNHWFLFLFCLVCIFIASLPVDICFQFYFFWCINSIQYQIKLYIFNNLLNTIHSMFSSNGYMKLQSWVCPV